MPDPERNLLRDLARQYRDLCADPAQDARRDLWRRHNSLQPTRPLIYARAFAWQEMPQSACRCTDPLLRSVENFFRHRLFWASLGDDSVFEPWVTVDAVRVCTDWGVEGVLKRSETPGGSYKEDYPLKRLAEVARLRMPAHAIDEARTAERVERIQGVLGDLLPIDVNRGPAFIMWGGDLSTILGHLRGIEHFMLDMLDDPDGLHRLVAFLSEGVLKTHAEAEAAGDWGLDNHQNQAMPYALELPDPAPNVRGVPRRKLWAFMAAQEFTAVSPAMHEEFLLRYQLPILKEFGLVAYGCCEDLTRKIDLLRTIPNLRRIAVSPFADIARCAEQIGTDYVLSYRPSPSDMVGYGFDAQRIRDHLRRDLQLCRDTHVDITLKDVETVERDPERVRNWVALVRDVIDSLWV